MQDRLQPQRFELKYIISESKALAVRDFVRSYLQLDEYGESMPDLSYHIHSIYLDSDNLQLYQDTINGNRNRFKLRMRYYDEEPDSPVFFEIKRRKNNCILKQRGAVRGEWKREAVPWLLAGHFPDEIQLLSTEPKYMVAIQRFILLMNQLRAAPRAHVHYRREAWISRGDNSIRVTMDREVVCAPEFAPTLGVSAVKVPHVFGNKVVLELKFTDRFPVWFQVMVESLGLLQTSAAKYADGIYLLGPERFSEKWTPVSGHGRPRRPMRASMDRRRRELVTEDAP
ncbi:MAG TPA: polyphosphate polymerase domain-containing protein [Candidatus Paceibacterota bacterium]|nr:polyphosphate polymerase domain-containing protein [Verrucomicrobiota bacterium]HOX04648.1 polyphosphate polymerase domain-containing protein [Verrucomicrobiota bacterium]HRZ44210.1 polyphosphate polymerase domain-containing protein [Candidatus Paceibacterota bacterium]